MCYDIASVMVEDNDELHTVTLCRNCYSLRQGKRKEPTMTNRMWKGARGKLAVGVGTRGLEQADIRGQEDQRGESAQSCDGGSKFGKELPDTSPHNEELALVRESKDMRLPGVTVRRAIKAGWEF